MLCAEQEAGPSAGVGTSVPASRDYVGLLFLLFIVIIVAVALWPQVHISIFFLGPPWWCGDICEPRISRCRGHTRGRALSPDPNPPSFPDPFYFIQGDRILPTPTPAVPKEAAKPAAGKRKEPRAPPSSSPRLFLIPRRRGSWTGQPLLEVIRT